MAKERCKETPVDSLFGNFLYDQKVAKAHFLRKLLEKDLAKGLEICAVSADKGYDDGENHYYLEQKGINSAIRLNNRRTKKKDANKDCKF